MMRFVAWVCLARAGLAATPQRTSLLRSEAQGDLTYSTKEASAVTVHSCVEDADCNFDGCNLHPKCHEGTCFTIKVGAYKCEATEAQKDTGLVAKIQNIEDEEASTWCINGVVYKMCYPATCKDIELPMHAVLTQEEKAQGATALFSSCEEGFNMFKEKFCDYHLLGTFFCRKTCSRCSTSLACYLKADSGGCKTGISGLKTFPVGKWTAVPAQSSLLDCADAAVEYTKKCNVQVNARWAKDPDRCEFDEPNLVGSEQCKCGIEQLPTADDTCMMTRCKYDCANCTLTDWCKEALAEKKADGARTQSEALLLVLREGDRFPNPGGTNDSAPKFSGADCGFDGCCGCAGLCNRCWKRSPHWMALHGAGKMQHQALTGVVHTHDDQVLNGDFD